MRTIANAFWENVSKKCWVKLKVYIFSNTCNSRKIIFIPVKNQNLRDSMSHHRLNNFMYTHLKWIHLTGVTVAKWEVRWCGLIEWGKLELCMVLYTGVISFVLKYLCYQLVSLQMLISVKRCLVYPHLSMPLLHQTFVNHMVNIVKQSHQFLIDGCR